jgi:DNA-binding response OmpR family regulator
MRVMIVSDNSSIGLRLEDGIRRAGYGLVGRVPSTGAAMLLAAHERPSLAVVDLDLHQGREVDLLVRRLKSELNIPSLLISSDDENARGLADVALGLLVLPSRFGVINAVMAAMSYLVRGLWPSRVALPSELRLFDHPLGHSASSSSG